LNIIDLLSPTERTDYNSLESLEGKRLFLQGFFKRNFLAFVWLLGYRDLGKFHYKQLLEISKFRFLTDVPVRRLWLWSRGFFKTSLITEAHTLWLIVNNPNIRVLIVSFSLEVAKKPFGVLRNHLIGNEDFRYFFREFCPLSNKDGKIEFGTTEYFTVPNRTKALKEPTVMCAGVGTNITGLHFDVQKIDDLVNKDSVTNETQVQQSKDYFSLLGPIFDNPTCPRQDVIGTIYHFFDLHSVLLKNDKFSSSIVPVYDSDHVFAFPERISQEAFEKEIAGDPNNNPYDIQSQYLLNPINPADAKFKEEWWKEYESIPVGLSEYILCDPASTQKKKSDFTVIQVWGVDSEFNFYLLDGIRDKFRANDRVRHYVSMARKCKRLKGAKYEEIGGRQGDLENINDEFIKHRLPTTVKPTKNTTATKVDRIEQRLVGQFHAGKVWMPKSIIHRSEFDGKPYDFAVQFKMEFLQFPFSEHDDILDCFSQLFDGEFIMKGDTTKHEVEKDHFDWWRNKAIESRKTHPRKRYIFGNKGIKERGKIPATEGYA
jgi:phage terminase large subunit-like protein